MCTFFSHSLAPLGVALALGSRTYKGREADKI